MSPRAAAAFAAAVLLPSALVAQVSYAPILALDYSVTGVLGTTTNSANQDVVYTGDGPGRQGLLYVGNLFGGGTTNVLNPLAGRARQIPFFIAPTRRLSTRPSGPTTSVRWELTTR